jgi:hypothetical protein
MDAVGDSKNRESSEPYRDAPCTVFAADSRSPHSNGNMSRLRSITRLAGDEQTFMLPSLLQLESAMKRAEAIHRKLRGLAAVLKDTAATEHERLNAEAIKTRLEKKLVEDGVAKGDWTEVVFRLGRAAQEVKKATSPPASSRGTSKIAFRLGRTLAEGLKRWRST